jgi:hypothetical protein
MCELVISTAIKNGDLKMSNTDNYEQLENFLVKVSEMYQYNLEQYPEENPTMIGAFNEILDEIKNNR